VNWKKFKPVTISKHGEQLSPYPLVGSELEVTENSYIWSGDGFDETYASGRGLVHSEPCGSFIDLEEISKTHYALICRGCSLRICVPMKVKKWGQLRKYFRKGIRK